MRSQPLERKIEFAQLFNDRLLPLFEAGRLQPAVDRVFAEFWPELERAERTADAH